MFFSCVIRFPLTIQVLLITVQCGSIGLNLGGCQPSHPLRPLLQPREGGLSRLARRFFLIFDGFSIKTFVFSNKASEFLNKR